MLKDESNYNLLQHNTFGISETCQRFIEFSSVEELMQILPAIKAAGEQLLIIGAGSNLLLVGPYEGMVVRSAIMGIDLLSDADDEVLVRCGSGETFDNVIQYCLSQGWYGMENLSIIPGDVGASAVQNIGAYGVEAKDVIESVEAVEISSGRLMEIAAKDCNYSYRQSRFKGEWKNRFIITHVTYRLKKRFSPRLDYGNIRATLDAEGITDPTPMQLREAIIKIRNAKLPDPKVTGNAGSFFMNPIVSREKFNELSTKFPAMPHYYVDEEHEKIPAGWMIDQLGWRGKSLGNAAVHDKQALVLINRGNASGADIVRLCNAIRQDVKQHFGIDIRPEVNIVGKSDEC